MAFSSGSDTTRFVIEVDAAGAVRVLDRVGNELKKIERQAEDTGRAADKAGGALKTAFVGVAGGFGAGLATAALGELKGALQAIPDALRDAQRVEGLTRGFENLQAAAGALASQSLAQLRTATKGLVADLDLMQSANQAVLLGLPVKGFDELAGAAQRLGQAMGITAKEAVDSLVIGIGRQSKLVLDNLGVIVEAEAAYERYAKANKTTADSLTDLQKKTAFYEAAQEAILGKARQLPEVQDTAAIAFQRLGVATENQRNAFIQALSANDSLAASLNDLAITISKIDFKPMADGLASLVATATSAVKPLLDVVRVLEQTQFLTEFFSGKVDGGRSDRLFGNALGNFFGDAFSNITKGLVPPKVTSATIKGIGDTGAASKKAAKEAEQLARALAGLDDSLSNLLEIDRLPGVSTQLRDVFVQLEGGQLTATQAKAKILELGAAFTKTTDGVRDYAAAISQAKQKAKEFIELQGFEQKLAADHFELEQKGKELGVGGAIDALFANTKPLDLSFTGILKNVFDLTDAQADLAGQIGSSISGAFLEVASALQDGSIGRDEIAAVGTAASTAIGTAIGAAVATTNPLAGAVVGGSIGSATGGLLNLAASLFESSDSAGTTARKEADAFFADLFDANRLSIVINGELSRISDLVFKGDTLFGGNVQFDAGGTFDDFFHSLETNGRNAIFGVGAAFEQLLGVGEDMSGQLAAVLANNIGGELLNIQSLVASTGQSFEALGDAVIQAFVNGTLSIQEAQIALEGLQQAFTVGTGDLRADFEALQAALSDQSGSQIFLTALRSIAADAQAFQLNTLPELAHHLSDVLKLDAQQVSAFFQAMTATGISSVQALVDASNAALIALGSNIQAITQGAAPTAKPVVDPTVSATGRVAPTNFAGATYPKPSKEGGGGKSKREDDFSKQNEELVKLISNSALYQQLEDAIEAGQIKKRKGRKLEGELFKEAKQINNQILSVEKKIEEETKKKVVNLQKVTTLKKREADLQEKLNQLLQPEGAIIDSAIYKAVTGTEVYGDILDKVRGKQLTFAQAGDQLKALYGDLVPRLRKVADAERDLEQALSRQGTISSEELGRLTVGVSDAREELSKFGQLKFEELQKQLLPVHSAMDAIHNLTVEGLISPTAETELVKLASNADALAVALDGLGISAEELEKAAYASFNTGKVSAGEFARAIDSIREATIGGLPGLGQVQEAFQKLYDTGYGGGGLLVESFRDLIVESKEAGLSLGGLQQELINSGVLGREEIGKLYDILRTNGINTLEDLDKASKPILAKILGDLQNAGVKLGTTTDETKKLLQTLDELFTGEKALKVKFEADTTPNFDALIARLEDIPNQLSSVFGNLIQLETKGVGQTRRISRILKKILDELEAA